MKDLYYLVLMILIGPILVVGQLYLICKSIENHIWSD